MSKLVLDSPNEVNYNFLIYHHVYLILRLARLDTYEYRFSSSRLPSTFSCFHCSPPLVTQGKKKICFYANVIKHGSETNGMSGIVPHCVNTSGSASPRQHVASGTNLESTTAVRL